MKDFSSRIPKPEIDVYSASPSHRLSFFFFATAQMLTKYKSCATISPEGHDEVNPARGSLQEQEKLALLPFATADDDEAWRRSIAVVQKCK